MTTYYRINWHTSDGTFHGPEVADFVTFETMAGLGAWLSQLDLVGGIVTEMTELGDREAFVLSKLAYRKRQREKQRMYGEHRWSQLVVAEDHHAHA